MDKYGYPEEAELERIRTWLWEYGFTGLMDIVHEMWYHADFGYWTETKGDEYTTYKIATAGWSGNEDIIGALKDNYMFWITCWQMSKRGGYYEFRVPRGIS
jgi:hypothetical protein